MNSPSTEPVARSWVGVLRLAGVQAAAGAVAFGVAVLATRWFRDPVEVVGRPLVDGYSERAESAAWGAFLAATGLLSALAARRRWPAAAETAASLFAPVPFLLAFWRGSPTGLALCLAAGAAAFGARGRLPFAGGFLLWAATFPWLAWEDAGAVALLLGPMAAMATLAAMPRLIEARPRVAAGLRSVLATAAGVFVATAGVETLASCAIGAVAWGTGARVRAAGADFRQAPWLAACVAMVVPMIGLNLERPYGDAAPAALVLAGAGLGAMAASIRRPSLPNVAAAVRTLPLAAAGVLIVVGVIRPWCLAVLAPALAAAWFGRPRWGWAWAVAATLPVAFLSSGPPPMPFDPFHDAQILSAVREVNRGRALYADVFPLRGYDFFLAWSARRFLPPTPAAFAWLADTLQFLPLAGAALLAFAWTRSLPWTLATALALAVPFAQDGRTGWHFWFAAAALAVLRSCSVVVVVVWTVAGIVAAAWGYDLFVPFAVASVLGAVATGRRHLAVATLVLLVLPWTLLLALWQGADSATTYWRLLVDYSRHYPAAYGLPLPWDDERLWPMILTPLVVAGYWAGGVGAAWRRLAPARRGMAVFLIVQFALAGQRALGRSDEPHLSSMAPLTLVWSLLGLWSVLTAAGSSQALRRTVALVTALAALLLTPHGAVMPSDWLTALRRVRDAGPFVLPRSPRLAARLGPSDTVWDVQNADVYLAYDRDNPTRHALAYCIPSPAEQKAALAALQRRPPRLIFWRHASRADLVEPDIPNPLRYHLIAPWVYRNYRPLESSPRSPLEPASLSRLVLEPAPPGWPGMEDLDERSGGPLPLGWLAERWGAEPAARITPSERRPVALGRAEVPIHPREWNYLLINASADGPTTAKLEFSRADGSWDAASPVSWRLTGDGRARRYLIPIACSPAWSWRREVAGLRCAAADGRLEVQAAELWRVEE